MYNRRQFLMSTAAAGTFLATHGISTALIPAWAQSNGSTDLSGLKILSDKEYQLSVDQKTLMIDGKPGNGIVVNDQLPAPLLRWKEGDEITLKVKNNLKVDTSIHWHGILLPFQMDGVPDVTFPGIKPGETFTYKFPVIQAGTYWYHSHSGLQEQSGHYGPIIIEPKDGYPQKFDREYVVVLSDWTFENPHRLFDKLKKMGHGYNFQQRDLPEFLNDVKKDGLGATISDRNMWGSMRMTPTDLSDVTGASYSYLINGHGPKDNWTGIFNPGERVRLRFINAAAMTIFNVRIPELPMTVVQADGLDVKPVETDEFQIGVAETYDVIIEPKDQAYTLMCESIERAGYARATLTPRLGMEAPVPELRERPKLAMKDMGGMDHSAMGHAMPEPEVDHAAMGHAMPEPEVDH
ncbi:MAG: copper resistance system multicopper oxidase, partial [Emcibacteraceae bacterium]|nr:copper resistance system multicopper oxidase [Emcibacteraceae bacterium]